MLKSGFSGCFVSRVLAWIAIHCVSWFYVADSRWSRSSDQKKIEDTGKEMVLQSYDAVTNEALEGGPCSCSSACVNTADQLFNG